MNEDKAARYQRLRRRASVAAVLWSGGLLTWLTWSGVAVGLRRLVESWVGSDGRVLGVACYVATLLLLHETGAGLLSYLGGFRLDRRYGVSSQTAAQWCADEVKAWLVTVVVAVPAAAATLWTMDLFPRWWWAAAAAGFTLFVALMAGLAPVLLFPLFYTIKPLEKDELRSRLLRLAERAGARVLGAYEWGLGEKSRKANAALAGLGATRRILVSDTMLADYSDDEIEVVLAHELAHHVHGDLWKGLVIDGLLMFVAFFAADRAIGLVGPRAGLSGSGDLAALPLLLLATGAVFLAASPIVHARSRAHERRADRFALELTRNPAAFVSAMRRLGQQNLAEPEPSRLTTWLFHSHPPLQERIAIANAFRA